MTLQLTLIPDKDNPTEYAFYEVVDVEYIKTSLNGQTICIKFKEDEENVITYNKKFIHLMDNGVSKTYLDPDADDVKLFGLYVDYEYPILMIYKSKIIDLKVIEG